MHKDDLATSPAAADGTGVGGGTKGGRARLRGQGGSTVSEATIAEKDELRIASPACVPSDRVTLPSAASSFRMRASSLRARHRGGRPSVLSAHAEC